MELIAFCHEISLLLYSLRMGAESAAVSSAMDIPFPVSGGIMQMLSPIRHSEIFVVHSRRREIPETAQKLSWEYETFPSRLARVGAILVENTEENESVPVLRNRSA